jgi:hypothetical protein
MVDWSSHLGNIWWRPRCRVRTARVGPLHPPCARGIAIFAALVSRNVSDLGPVWRDGDYCLSAQFLLELLELTSLAKWKSAVTSIGTLFVTSFLGVENCSPANVVVALVDFTQGVSFTLKHLRWFLKENVWFPHLDIFSNMQVFCVARTHSYMGESLWARHSFGEKWWPVFAPVVMEPFFCCRKLFCWYFGCSSLFT